MARGALRILALVLPVALLVPACSSKGSGGSGRSNAVKTTTKVETPTPTPAPAPTPPPAPAPAPTGEITDDKEAVADALSAAALTSTTVYTNGSSSAETCVNVGFTAKKAGTVLPDIVVSFAIVPVGDMVDPGKMEPVDAKTNAQGLASSTYCSGATEGTVTVTARIGTLSSNSAEIKVVAKPEYSFRYLRSEIEAVTPAEAAEGGSGTGSEAVPVQTAPPQISLNLLDAGPKDCTTLYFKLSRDGAGISGKEIVFRTQVDYPKGAKLAKKADTGTSDVEAGTGKKFGTYAATSGSQGIFAVPVCAGVDLGTIVVTGVYTDEEAKTYTVQSPVVAINAGLTNFANMSLTFDAKNAKTIRGYFNTNADEKTQTQNFLVKLGARQDGDPIPDFPVAVTAETGKIMVENSGYPKIGEGTVKFTMLAQHMVNYRPYPVVSFSSAPAQTLCDAYSLSLESTDTSYVTLRKNWRSTVVYMVRGQEHFNDANKNGVFDSGGDGFWDKNQNGIYDTGDVLTLDVGEDGLLAVGSEWFIDLPTPFIDVDEDNTFTLNKDVIVGDAYSNPNGKRDADTLIWKSEVVPIYMGTSPFAMQHGVITAGNLNNAVDAVGSGYFSGLATKGLRDTLVARPLALFSDAAADVIDDTDLFGAGASAAIRAGSGSTWRYFFAHDVCGNAPPGETEINVTFEATGTPATGARALTAHFFIQPGDQILEPSRRILADAAGAATAKINFNVMDHPSAAASYPVEFQVKIGPCLNECSGVAFDETQTNGGRGRYCGAGSAIARLAFDGDTIGKLVSYGEVKTCTCDPTAAIFDPTTGACNCPADKPNWDGTICKAPPP